MPFAAIHYLRPIGSGDDAGENSLAYERLAKEGRGMYE